METVKSTSKPFVVIVDDIQENVRILHHALREQPYSFAIAYSGNELLRILETYPVTLILLDVMLPDIDGFTLAKQILADERYKEIPIIFVTARAEQEDKLRGFEAGGVDYVSKPFDSREILQRVRTHVNLRLAMEEQKRLNRELQEALDRVKKLEGIIPICSSCKKIRSDEGYWTQVEQYISEHTGVMFSHSLCPDCASKLFPKDVLDESST
ncbi:response regulator [Gracilinema caldarium]|uniref:Response regulator receiver protein n=1 Tax=Gracilinema caldarium (strain ATCC 51460 / DSM 7334 / H1) TaxID=744872 RepID=F8EZU8_GRAC1|nr:response regulator [Gracilinema caldarium]AEJ18461.1 response regulator receiver protein [Gracilinema caldarium DSM 7334]